MANLLYLVHRLPYPPNKGDKVRSYHLLKHLAVRHKVYLGTFVDDPDDEQHVPRVRSLCADMTAVRLAPLTAKVRSLTGLMTGQPLSLPYYRSTALSQWVTGILAKTRIDATVVFSSAMSQYAPPVRSDAGPTLLIDFVDVDSEKWAQYATQRKWPMSWVYAREGRTLLAHERMLAACATQSFFVTDKETDLFRRLAPESANRVQAIGNGVDAEYFSPQEDRDNPFDSRDIPIVFTGAMDYWPNIDAVTWFVAEALPDLRKSRPEIRFYVVGRNPPPAIQALASDRVVVTGTVPDVRPYLQHAAVVVAPMRLARGVQNKVLEAMAMARPVVAAAECVSAIQARDGEDLCAAARVEDYVRIIGELIADQPRANMIGNCGRARVVEGYSWDAQLAVIDQYLPRAGAGLSGEGHEVPN